MRFFNSFSPSISSKLRFFQFQKIFFNQRFQQICFCIHQKNRLFLQRSRNRNKFSISYQSSNFLFFHLNLPLLLNQSTLLFPFPNFLLIPLINHSQKLKNNRIFHFFLPLFNTFKSPFQNNCMFTQQRRSLCNFPRFKPQSRISGISST